MSWKMINGKLVDVPDKRKKPTEEDVWTSVFDMRFGSKQKKKKEEL